MTTLEKLVNDLRKKKREATRLKNKSAKQLKEYKSLERRSSSGLNTIAKKIESQKEDASDVSEILLQKNAQIESIERLISTAKERLETEKEAITQVEQEIEYSDNPEEKGYAESRLRSLKDHVGELELEIKNRSKTAKKISDDVSKFNNIKSTITSKIQKQTHSKPALREKMVSSHKEAAKLAVELEKRTRAEESAKKALDKATKKLNDYQAKKPTKKKPAKKTATRKPAKKTVPGRKVVTGEIGTKHKIKTVKKKTSTKKMTPNAKYEVELHVNGRIINPKRPSKKRFNQAESRTVKKKTSTKKKTPSKSFQVDGGKSLGKTIDKKKLTVKKRTKKQVSKQKTKTKKKPVLTKFKTVTKK